MQALFEARLFEFDYAEGLPTVAWADQELLFMALDNVLTNAVKFSPEGSSIRLEVFADSALHFRVSDRGPGIHPEHIARLYAIYNRLQQKDFTGGVTGGFGIGLAIAQRVAQAHGGSLDYADRAGGGAVFTFSLPLKPASRASGASV
jgi:signal transduction histidine kinase